MLATVLDRKTGKETRTVSGVTMYDRWHADIASATDYYPGGMMMPGRNKEYRWSRHGYNGQAKDDEVYGKGNLNSALFWEMDTRILKRWNVDPVMKPWESSYAVFADNPIAMVDPTGDTYFFNTKGDLLGWDGVNNNVKLMAVNEKTVTSLLSNATTASSVIPIIQIEKNKTQFDLFPVVSESEINSMENIFNVAETNLAEAGMIGGTDKSGNRHHEISLENKANSAVRMGDVVRAFYKNTKNEAEYDAHGHPPIFKILNGSGDAEVVNIGTFKYYNYTLN